MKPRTLIVPLLLTCGVQAQQPRYDVVELGLLPGSNRSRSAAVNDAAEVLADGSWPAQSFVHTPSGGQRILPSPTGGKFKGHDINERGFVLGLDVVRNGSTQGILAPDGTYTMIWPDIRTGGVRSLNDSLAVVGGGEFGTNTSEPFYWSPPTGIVQITPGRGGLLTDINDRGEAIGNVGGQNGIWTLSGFTPLPFYPEVINDVGQVVGGRGNVLEIYTPGRGTQRIPGFSFSNGMSALGMNDHGVVVGIWSYRISSGSTQIWRTGPFLYTPTGGLVEPDQAGLFDPAWEVLSLVGVNDHGHIAAYGRLRSVGVDWQALRLDPASPAARSAQVGSGCGGAQTTPALDATPPALAHDWTLTISNARPGATGATLFGTLAPSPLPIGGGCSMLLDTSVPLVPMPIAAVDPLGRWEGALRVPPRSALLGVAIAAQAVLTGGTGPLGVDLSNAVDAAIGF